MATKGAVGKLRRLQTGREATAGTAVAATDRLLGKFRLTDMASKQVPEVDAGLLSDRVEKSVETTLLGGVALDTDLSFEQILHILESSIGTVTPTEITVSQGDYQYVYTPTETALPTLKTYTFEYVETDGASNIVELRGAYGICDQFTIAGAQGEALASLRAHWHTNGLEDNTATADPGFPSRILVPGNIWTVKFATTFAGLDGASILTAEVVDFEFTYNSGIMPKFRQEGSQDYEAHRVGAHSAQLSLTLDVEATAEAERATLFREAAAGNRDTTFIRLEALGAQIGTGTNYQVRVDLCAELSEQPEFGDDEDGQSILPLTYNGVYDATGTKMLTVSITNELTAVP
jgi:hypothetical protein